MVNSANIPYAYPREYYEPVAADLLNLVGNKTKIVVFADPKHWTRNKDMRNGDYSIDYSYRDNVISFFQSRGFSNVTFRDMSPTPDVDFLSMSSARYFVQGGGGYSELIANLVTHNGGRVFQPRKSRSNNTELR